MKIVYKNNIKILTTDNSLDLSSSKNKPRLILNNSQSESAIEKDKGLFYIYDNLFLNKNFEENISQIIHQIYEHNDETLFRFFLIKRQKSASYRIVEFVSHLVSYPSYTLRAFNTKTYKNTGLIFNFDLYLIFACPNNFKISQLTKNILDNTKTNISEINKNFDRFSLFNFNTHQLVFDRFDMNDELLLIVHYEFEPQILKINQFTAIDSN